MNHILHLSQHERVIEHHDLSAENLRFLLTHPFPDVICHLLGYLTEGFHRLLQALFLLFASLRDYMGIVQTLLLDADDFADSDSS